MHVPPADQKLPDVVEAEFVAAFLDQIILSQGFRPVGRGNRGKVDVSSSADPVHDAELGHIGFAAHELNAVIPRRIILAREVELGARNVSEYTPDQLLIIFDHGRWYVR